MSRRIDDSSDSSLAPSNGRLPGEHLVEHGAEREDVGARVDGLALGLLRGHVGGCPEQDAEAGAARGAERGGHRVGRAALGADQLGEAEVEHLHEAGLRDHHVPGLDVAVDDPGLVGGGEAARDLERDPQRLGDRQAAPLEPLAQALAVHQLHRDPGAARRVLADLVHGDDVGVGQRRGRLRFLQEAARALGIGHRLGRSSLMATVRPRRVSRAR